MHPSQKIHCAWLSSFKDFGFYALSSVVAKDFLCHGVGSGTCLCPTMGLGIQGRLFLLELCGTRRHADAHRAHFHFWVQTSFCRVLCARIFQEQQFHLVRFRSNADKLPGVERVAIMSPDAQMLEFKFVPMKPLGPVGRSLRLDFFVVSPCHWKTAELVTV